MPRASTNFIYCGAGAAACAACTVGQACLNGACTDVDAGAGVIGAPCDAGIDCTGVPNSPGGGIPYCKTQGFAVGSTGLLEPTYAYPGGVCTRRCSSNTQCGAGAVCMIYGGVNGDAESVCSKSCGPGNSCRSGYVCIGFGGSVGAVCVVRSADGGVPRWDAGTGANDGVMGEACVNDGQCKPPATATCVSSTLPDGGPSIYPNGSCTADCSMSLQEAYCGAITGTCYPYINNTLEGPLFLWACQKKCNPTVTPTACRPEYWCWQAFGSADPTYGLCVSRCTNPGASCGARMCNVDAGWCE